MNAPAPAVTNTTSLLQPPAALIMGESGAGKTSSLATFLERGIETFVICTEPGGPESLLDWAKKKSFDVNKLHWTMCPPTVQGVDALLSLVTEISTKDFETISKNKAGIGKDKTRAAAMKLLSAMQNFICERTGQSFGDYTTWDDSRALCVDSLSGISTIAWALTVGYKPTAHMGEWNIAMNFIDSLLTKLISDRKCFFAMTAHVEKEMNELTGVNQLMVSTLGRKLAPKIPKFFSEVVYAKRGVGDQGKFTWSTTDATVALKNRALPIKSDLVPSFSPLVDAYRERKKALGQ